MVRLIVVVKIRLGTVILALRVACFKIIVNVQGDTCKDGATNDIYGIFELHCQL